LFTTPACLHTNCDKSTLPSSTFVRRWPVRTHPRYKEPWLWPSSTQVELTRPNNISRTRGGLNRRKDSRRGKFFKAGAVGAGETSMRPVRTSKLFSSTRLGVHSLIFSLFLY